MTTIPVERDLLERVLSLIEHNINFANHPEDELRALLAEQPQAGAGQADEVRQNSERWKYFGGRLAAKLGTTLELMNADIDAALTQSPKGEEE